MQGAQQLVKQSLEARTGSRAKYGRRDGGIWPAANELTFRDIAIKRSGNSCLIALTVNPSHLFSGARMCEDGCL